MKYVGIIDLDITLHSFVLIFSILSVYYRKFLIIRNGLTRR